MRTETLPIFRKSARQPDTNWFAYGVNHIFINDADREDLIGRLEELIPSTGTASYAWALL
jgi:hypothetical protein